MSSRVCYIGSLFKDATQTDPLLNRWKIKYWMLYLERAEMTWREHKERFSSFRRMRDICPRPKGKIQLKSSTKTIQFSRLRSEKSFTFAEIEQLNEFRTFIHAQDRAQIHLGEESSLYSLHSRPKILELKFHVQLKFKL